MKGFVTGVALALGLAGSASAQFTATMPVQSTVYNGMTRGYYFTAPVGFIITGVKVLPQTGSTNSFQNFAVIHFTGNVPPGDRNSKRMTSAGGGRRRPREGGLPRLGDPSSGPPEPRSGLGGGLARRSRPAGAVVRARWIRPGLPAGAGRGRGAGWMW